MSKPETLKIDDVEYVRKDSVYESKNLSKDVRIVILQRGWVVVGRYSQDGSNCLIEQASVIRSWGTKKGLGEIVSGPTSSTVLDPCGVVRCHEMAVVATLDCEASKWSQHLK